MQSKLTLKSLQHPLTDHCNLRCDNCSSLSPYLPKHFSSLEQFSRDINYLKKHFTTKNFIFLGGEPLLHKQIENFVDVVRNGFTDRVEIQTNGALVSKMSDSLLSKVDNVIISAYPNTGIDYKLAVEFLTSKGVSYQLEYKKHFYPTYRSCQETDKETNQKTYDNCLAVKEYHCHTIKDGYYYKCAIPYSKSKFDGYDNTQDGVKIDENVQINLLKYLKSSDYLNSCSWCHGTDLANKIPHTQLVDVRSIRRSK